MSVCIALTAGYVIGEDKNKKADRELRGQGEKQRGDKFTWLVRC